jgi:DNA-binding CsgD family transcriptional regulator
MILHEVAPPLRIALAIDDPKVWERAVTLLEAARGIELVDYRDSADLVLTAAGRAEPPLAAPDLTARERDVLLILAEGASNKEIARRLGISVGTVKFHVAAIMEKLDATGRVDAVAHAARLGVIHL